MENNSIEDQSQILNENGSLLIPLKSKKKFKKDDFDIITLSGKGAYGTVLKVKYLNDTSDKFYALKILDIRAIHKINKLYQAYLECDILSNLSSPYIVEAYGAFEDDGKIFIVMEYLPNGDFSDFLKMNYPLKDEAIRFYCAEIVCFLEYIQNNKIIHRDLKPENIMINENFHLQVIDFGTARVIGKIFDKIEMKFKNENEEQKIQIPENNDIKGIKEMIVDDEDDEFNEEFENMLLNKTKVKQRGMTFVGTAEYVSPEVIGDLPACYGSDIWALGIMLYQMYYGKTPFKDKTSFLIFKNIQNLKIDFPSNINVPEDAKDLITKLLIKDPNQRLGGGEPGTEFDIIHLKNHPYFKNINWENLYKLNPPNKECYNKSLQNLRKSLTGLKKKEKAKDDKKNNEVLDPKTEIIKEGFLDKKSPWIHYNKRKIILYKTPKLVYIDPDKNEVKGEIILNKKSKINHINFDTFEVITEQRSYRFKGKNSESMIWEKCINDCIKKYGK